MDSWTASSIARLAASELSGRFQYERCDALVDLQVAAAGTPATGRFPGFERHVAVLGQVADRDRLRVPTCRLARPSQ